MPRALLLALITAAAATHLEDAETAIRAGRFDEALQGGQAFLSSGGGSADEQLRARRVVGLAELGLADEGSKDAAAQYRDAVGHLQAYRAQHGSELAVQAKLGEALLRTGSLDDGLALLEPLIPESAIPDVHVWEAMAQAKQTKGDARGARLAAKACLRLDDADAACKRVLAAVGQGAPPSKKPKH